MTLAAVFLLPVQTPGRDYLQFLAFVVVVGTLFEGLALPRIIKALKLPMPNWRQEMDEAHRLMAEAQLAGLARLEAELVENPVDDRVIVRLRTNAEFLTQALDAPSAVDAEPVLVAYNRLRRSMILAERDAVLTARAEGRYQEPAVRTALASIDLEEAALKANKPRKPGSNLT